MGNLLSDDFVYFTFQTTIKMCVHYNLEKQFFQVTAIYTHLWIEIKPFDGQEGYAQETTNLFYI